MTVRQLSILCRPNDAGSLLAAATKVGAFLHGLGVRHFECSLIPFRRAFVVRILASEEVAITIFSQARMANGPFSTAPAHRFFVDPADAAELQTIAVHLGARHAAVDQLLADAAGQGLSWDEVNCSPSPILDWCGLYAMSAPTVAPVAVSAVKVLGESIPDSALMTCVPSTWLESAISTGPLTSSVVVRFPDYPGALHEALAEADALPGVKQLISALRVTERSFEAAIRLRHATAEEAATVVAELERLRSDGRVVTDAFKVEGHTD